MLSKHEQSWEKEKGRDNIKARQGPRTGERRVCFSLDCANFEPGHWAELKEPGEKGTGGLRARPGEPRTRGPGGSQRGIRKERLCLLLLLSDHALVAFFVFLVVVFDVFVPLFFWCFSGAF